MRGLGIEVVLVSSGAIAVGRRHLGLETGTLRLEEKQAAAATGQIRLAHAYQERLARHDITVAQILLTLDDTEERNRHLNARSTLNTLLKMEAVPVINENDTVATAEIKFGDNDRLGARVASMLGADRLVLLSDVDGLYTANPGIDSIVHLAAHSPPEQSLDVIGAVREKLRSLVPKYTIDVAGYVDEEPPPAPPTRAGAPPSTRESTLNTIGKAPDPATPIREPSFRFTLNPAGGA